MTKTLQEKLQAILEAVRKQNFSEAIEDIDVLEYTDNDGKKWTDRFDYIDTTTVPCTICFIGNEDNGKLRFPISNLTQKSIDKLYECINQPAPMSDKKKASALLEFMEDEWDGKAIINALNPLLQDEDLANLYDQLVKDGVIRE